MPLREEVLVAVDKAATNGNDAATGESRGTKLGSINGGDTTDEGIFSGGLSFTYGDIMSTIFHLAILLCLLPVMINE